MPGRLSSHPAPAALVGQWSRQSNAPDTELLDWADPDPQARIILIGPYRLEMMCSLIRRGSWEVTTLRLPERPELACANLPEPACADLVVIADLDKPEALCRAAAQAHRALAPLGRVVIGVSRDQGGLLVATAIGSLQDRGYTVTSRHSGSRAMLCGERPWERRICA